MILSFFSTNVVFHVLSHETDTRFDRKSFEGDQHFAGTLPFDHDLVVAPFVCLIGRHTHHDVVVGVELRARVLVRLSKGLAPAV